MLNNIQAFKGSGWETRNQISICVQGKIQNISYLEGKGFCSNGQMKSNNLNETFPKLVSSFKIGNQEGPVTDMDVRTGLELYHAIVYCPELDMKLYRFVDHFLQPGMKELPTFLQDTKHTLQIVENINTSIDKN